MRQSQRLARFMPRAEDDAPDLHLSAILGFYMFGKDGLINLALRPLGIDGPSYIGNPSFALYTLIVLNLWAFGSGMIIFLAGLRQIPPELYEAAQLDGAGRWARFWTITLPLLTPVLFFNAVLGLVGGFQAFTSAYVVSNGTGGPADATLLYQVYLYQRGFVNLNMGYACAMARGTVVKWPSVGRGAP